jgi:D-arabinose 1-dehydrogenase-like Zn-dependent alcohol dehydrogenase
MKAVVLREFGAVENLHLETLPDPTPGRGEVLLRVHACGVCYHDIIMRCGRIPGTRVPAVLGHEVVGEVIALGEGVLGWAIGDRAATLQRMSCGECSLCLADRPSLCKVDRRFFGEEIYGGYATLMTAPVRGIARVPAGIAAADAAIACCTTGTAVHVCRTRGGVGPGDTVLITGASGGVGLQAVQLCRLDGAQVIAVTSSPAKVHALEEAGAHHVVVSPDLRFSNEVRRIAGGDGVSVAIEIVGAKTFAQTLRCLAPGGRLVVVGNLDTAEVPINPSLIIVKELELLGAYATTRSELETAFQLTVDGKVRSDVAEVLPLSRATHAHFRLENREVAGRLVLQPD